MLGDVLLMVGTRPEAVKIAPVALAMADHPTLRPVIVHSGQHDDVVDQALEPFDLRYDERLIVLRAAGSQAELFSVLLPELDSLLARSAPTALLVQGDTATTLAGALAAFWRQIPVVHLEAGLRTHDLTAPFPEEGYRQMVTRIAALHLAPTHRAAAALRAEGIPDDRIVITGNTVVDAVEYIDRRNLPPRSDTLRAMENQLDRTASRLLLVTLHRRESWGAPLDRALLAVRHLIQHHPDLHVLLPVHPNPLVARQVHHHLDSTPRVHLTPPLDYPDLIRALRRASLVLTDSGGIQEEAPTFGVPVLVARDTTERTEGLHTGHATLVGTTTDRIVAAAQRLLTNARNDPAPANPYGDGNAAPRAVHAIEHLLATTDQRRTGVNPLWDTARTYP
ncbi:non-hydrolyzing UDP-N-acetylglucosamine 2-epimerase [Amycolatopsis sp. H20-H5]|uniref:non-hydrolyzing UDP-N-acetylglucosamine 2-epimerase n=1 Tax=Amycolatopsis sp. H20-H5 TaxID=3046309 RepID=UPI002DB84BEB|nr:UDP-N-acetylglucosamine 2-epimerase (non-hydrolyzing) [Amycolatopsis sp. H20-H5]MEC3982519.1 UDP-N-acetylglucosamine 2-epimerase (non-hydrolyzing) [Amycolatopsis sp. H20-H5]